MNRAPVRTALLCVAAALALVGCDGESDSYSASVDREVAGETYSLSADFPNITDPATAAESLRSIGLVPIWQIDHDIVLAIIRALEARNLTLIGPDDVIVIDPVRAAESMAHLAETGRLAEPQPPAPRLETKPWNPNPLRPESRDALVKLAATCKRLEKDRYSEEAEALKQAICTSTYENPTIGQYVEP